MKLAFSLAALLLGVALAVPAAAQNYPDKPIRIFVGYGPGGATDVAVRVIADELGKRLRQPVIVENRPGAGGLIAANAAKNATPDGYVLYGGSVLNFASVFLKENAMDAAKEMQPVSQIAQGDLFVFVRSDLGVNTLQQLAAKSKTSRLRFSSPSPTQYLLAAAIAKKANFEFDYIPYKTTEQVVMSMLGGDGDFTVNSLPGMPAHLQSGKVRAIASLGTSRSPLQPDVPTAKEQGVNVDMGFHLGLWAPRNTPAQVVQRLSAAVAEVVKIPAVVEKIGGLAMIPKASTSQELLRVHVESLRLYTDAATLTGYRPD